MNNFQLFAIIMLYLALLFFIAYWAEKKKSNFWANNPYIYSLSLAVYCTAWTYYGSIGVAANHPDFVTRVKGYLNNIFFDIFFVSL